MLQARNWVIGAIFSGPAGIKAVKLLEGVRFSFGICGVGFKSYIPGISAKIETNMRVATSRAFHNNATGSLGTLRYWLINTLIGTITVGSLFALATRREYWPFSPYDLYSGVSRNYSLTLLRLYGVFDGEAGEIPLFAFQYIQPFDNARLRIALGEMDRAPNRDQLLAAALQDCLKRYETQRLAGRHAGPPLQRIRLYRLHWQFHPWALNVSDPERRELLFEVGGL